MDHAQITEAEALSQQVFKAMMWALSYPGSIHLLPVTDGQSMLAVAETLVDLETSFFASTPELRTALTRLGARPDLPDQAQYHFYEQLAERDLPGLRSLSVGTLLDPEDSATLIIQARVGRGYPVELSGPGIRSKTRFQIEGIPPAFWAVRQEVLRFPLGWDLFLVDDNQLAGIPRTTHVEVVEWPI